LVWVALYGALSEQVILDDRGIQVTYAKWVPRFFRSGWYLSWSEVKALKPRTTGQGGLVYYFLSESGQGYLLPMRVAGFAQLVRLVEAKTAIDTTDVRPLAQPWMYLILLGLTLLLLLVDACPLGVHMHNDTGCAAANTFLGVELGATHVQGTMNGLGERCGNTNLCTVIPGIQLKLGHTLLSDERMRMLTNVSVYISEIANIAHDIRQPYVGESAFSHKAGTHADGVRKVRESFEHVEPESVGNSRRFVVSDQAGTSTIVEQIKGIVPDVDKKHPLVRQLLEKVVELESNGYQFEAADASFELIVRRALGHFSQPFEVYGFRVIEEKRSNGECFSEATIRVREKGVEEHTAADGDGPVNAIDNALRKALIKFFPSLKSVRLDDFKVRVLEGKDGTAAKVRVLIESSDGAQRWSTIGVSTNIIEASWLALIDSLMYKLMKESLDRETHSRTRTKQGSGS